MPLPIGTPTAEETAERARRAKARAKAIDIFGEEACEGMEIHHINGNNEDNRPSNIKLCTKDDHAKHHGRGRGRRGVKQLNNMKLETVNMGDIEIFEAGTFNGVEMTEGDIDELILNYKLEVTEPYITIDHNDDATDQFKEALKAVSLGFVSDLKRIGKKLVANFKQVPKQLAELIQAGALKKKSIEFYKKYLHANGEKYDNVLQGVTFHGANGSPAVTTLSDFVKLYKNDLNATINNDDNKNKILSLKLNEEIKMADDNKFEVELITLKKDHENVVNELTTLKADNETLQTQVTEKTEELVKLKNVEAELTTFKKEVEEKGKADLNDEAKKYVDEQINNKKIVPASKDMYVKNYITFKADEKAFATFKDDIEKRAELLDESSKTNIDGTTKATVDNLDNIDELIETKMKNKNADGTIKSFGDARKEVYAELGMEV